ncbi:MAG: hypothetical protein ABWZ19_11670 [Hyphomicrobium sp.]
MPEKFNAEILARSEVDRTNDRLEISLCDATGECRTVSLGANAVSALALLLADHTRRETGHLTKIPDNFAVGHGRHEPFVMLRFEDDPAYGLTAEQALGLGEALIDEAESMATTIKYPVRQ